MSENWTFRPDHGRPNWIKIRKKKFRIKLDVQLVEDGRGWTMDGHKERKNVIITCFECCVLKKNQTKKVIIVTKGVYCLLQLKDILFFRKKFLFQRCIRCKKLDVRYKM